MRPRPCLLAVLALVAGALGPASPALAQSHETRPVMVATDGAARLSAQDFFTGQLCVGFGTGDATLEGCGGVGGAAELSERSAGGGPRRVGAAVPASAARLEVRRGTQVLARARTVPGGRYRGRLRGLVRFGIVRLGARVRTDGLRLRAYDRAGALVAVLTPVGTGALKTGARTVLAGRAGTTRWSVRAVRRAYAEPSVADLEREHVQTCVQAVVPGVSTSEPDCRPPDLWQAVLGPAYRDRSGQPLVEETCRPTPFRLVHGTAPAGSRRAEVELGDGRRLAARGATEADGTLVYAAEVAARSAVRAVLVTGPDGAVTRQALGRAPLGLVCASGGPPAPSGEPDPSVSVADLVDQAPVVTPAGPVATGPGFRVADGPRGTLCLAAGTAPLRLSGCAVVAPGGGHGSTVLDDARRPTRVVEALPARVAAVRIGRFEGRLRTVSTVAVPSSTGVHTRRVRFLSARVASPHDVEREVYLDWQGRVLSESNAFSTLEEVNGPQLGPPRRLAAVPGGLALWRTEFQGGDGNPVCLALTAGAAPTRAAACPFDEDSDRPIILSSSCDTRQLTVAVTGLSGGGLRLETSTGEVQRVVSQDDAGLLTLPPGVGLRSIGSLRTAVPSPSAQCDWAAQIALSASPPRPPHGD